MFKTIFCRFPGIFNEKTTFEEFEDNCKKFIKNKKINIMMKKTIDSDIDLLTNSEKEICSQTFNLFIVETLLHFSSWFLNNFYETDSLNHPSKMDNQWGF